MYVYIYACLYTHTHTHTHMYIGKQRVIYAELPDDNVHDARAAMEEVYASSLMPQTLVAEGLIH